MGGLADAFTTRTRKISLVYVTAIDGLYPVNQRIQLIAVGMKTGLPRLSSPVLTYSKLNELFGSDVENFPVMHENIFARYLRFCIAMPALVSSASNGKGPGFWVLSYRVTGRLAENSTNVSVEFVEHSE